MKRAVKVSFDKDSALDSVCIGCLRRNIAYGPESAFLSIGIPESNGWTSKDYHNAADNELRYEELDNYSWTLLMLIAVSEGGKLAVV